MILGGPALFLAGHAAFKMVVWRVLSWPRLAGFGGQVEVLDPLAVRAALLATAREILGRYQADG